MGPVGECILARRLARHPYLIGRLLGLHDDTEIVFIILGLGERLRLGCGRV